MSGLLHVRTAHTRLLTAAAQLAHAARGARGAGASWWTIGQELGLDEAGDTYGRSVGELAFELVVEQQRPGLEPTPRNHSPRQTLTWMCDTCEHLVVDSGPYNTLPGDNERGHAAGCARLAADTAAVHSVEPSARL